MSVTQQETRNDELRAEVRKSSLEELRPLMPSLRQALQSLAKNPSDAAKLQELYGKIQDLAHNKSLTRLPSIARIVNAFEQLLTQLVEKPESTSPSGQR